MEPGTIILLVLVMLAGIFFGVLQSQSEEELRSAQPVSAGTLHIVSKLAGERTWSITIMRRSGYVHDAWTLHGTAKNAIDSGVNKLRQANIFDVMVRVDTPSKLDVIAFYESTGARRTGKYVGGFVIGPA